MSIFSKIKGAIFGHSAQAATAAPTAAEPTPTTASTPEPSATTASPVGGASAAPAPSASFDVAASLDAAVKKSGQKLDWEHSIVDLMKAVGMDASLSERKELAEELGYTGDTNDSAKMNMWLHKALLKKLSENGGKVPAELLD